ncbi:hypothetical protein ACH4Y0_03170 [Streptomyces sp. NPDC020707]|uniref:hypothetical protein n=1 Tax=Streptomyces sp. NPDC020707 TaxID=3365084 RepID=UPI00379BB13B
MPRSSVICDVTEHGPAQHSGLIRPLARPGGGAVWATWSTPEEVVCLARHDCDRQNEDQKQRCSLFGAHPGPCSYARDDALVEDPARATRITGALEILAGADQREGPDIQAAAHDAALLTWDELRARRIWTDLPPWDHAAMYQLLARAYCVHATHTRGASELAGSIAQMTRLWAPSASRRLPHGDTAAHLHDALDRLPPQWQNLVLGSQRDHRYQGHVRLEDALTWATHYTSDELPPPPAEPGWRAERDRKDDVQHGATTRERLASLPTGWQVHVLRSMALGEGALSAVAQAALSINTIRGYGIHHAWNAPPLKQPSPPGGGNGNTISSHRGRSRPGPV